MSKNVVADCECNWYFSVNLKYWFSTKQLVSLRVHLHSSLSKILHWHVNVTENLCWVFKQNIVIVLVFKSSTIKIMCKKKYDTFKPIRKFSKREFDNSNCQKKTIKFKSFLASKTISFPFHCVFVYAISMKKKMVGTFICSMVFDGNRFIWGRVKKMRLNLNQL